MNITASRAETQGDSGASGLASTWDDRCHADINPILAAKIITVTDLRSSDPSTLGVAPRWPSRKTVVKWLEKSNPRPIDDLLAYNSRSDAENTSNINSQQSSAGFQASICVPPICYGETVSGSASASDQTIKDNFQSVGQQSGIYAGTGGFDVNVGNHTQLNGGVVASTATADKNSLSTQTFGYTNLQNTADYSGSTIGGELSASSQSGSIPNSLTGGPQFSQTGNSASGTTYAAVSPGTITVRGDAGTGQDSTAGLSRNTASANGSVQNTFNAQNVANNMAIQQEFGQLATVAVGQIADELEANNPLFAEGGAGRDALHAAVAAIGAAISGGNVAGAVGGSVAGDELQLLAAPIIEQAISQLPADAKDAARNALDDIVATAGGALGGALAGGGTQGTINGAGSAANNEVYNKQLDPNQKKTLTQLQQGESGDEQQRLADAACALDQCAAQMSDSDPAKAAALASQQRGAGDITEQKELQATGLFPTYSYSNLATDLTDQVADAVAQQLASVGRGASNLGNMFVGLMNANSGQTGPADPNNQLPGGGGDNTSGTAGAVVTPAVPVPLPNGTIVTTPPLVSPGSAGTPGNAIFSSGESGNDSGSAANGQGPATDTTTAGATASTGTAGSSGGGGAAANAIGAAREQAVANEVGGTVSGEIIRTSSGSTDVDVTDAAGNLYAVGGPAKANNLGAFVQSLMIYSQTAAARGVNAYFYYASGTPQSVINAATKVLGSSFVKPIP